MPGAVVALDRLGAVHDDVDEVVHVALKLRRIVLLALELRPAVEVGLDADAGSRPGVRHESRTRVPARGVVIGEEARRREGEQAEHVS